jgi:hypothetical protein
MLSLTQIGRRPTPRPSFRHVLRTETRAEHEASEAWFAPFMEEPERHMVAFLAAQRAALAALELACARPGSPELAAVMPDTMRALDADCADRDIRPPALMVAHEVAPLAAGYLALGSRLGVEVMRRRLVEKDVRPVPRFFLQPNATRTWAAICAKLDAVDPDGAAADGLIEDTKTGYALFAQAAGLTFDWTPT